MRGSSALRTSVAPGGALVGPWARNPLWTRARAVPSLDLCFADTKSLVCATTGQNLVTFTRASSGTFVGSDGVLRSAVTNLLLQSQAITISAPWSSQSTAPTITANAFAAPNETTTATRVTFAAADSRVIQLNFSFTSGTVYTLSVYARPVTPGTLNTMRLAVFDGGQQNGSDTTLDPGWQRVSFTFTASSTTASGTVQFRNATNTAANDVYLWGAQLEQASTVGDYIPTTSVINSAPRFDHNPTTGESLGLLVEEARTNLRTYSDAILTANVYGASNSTLVAASIANPFGGTTASLFTLNVGANTGNNTDGFNFGSATTLANSTAHAQSIFVKPAGATVLRLRSNVGGALFDFTLTGNGTAPSPSSDLQSASIVPFPNGWYRVSWTFTTTTTAPGNRSDYWTIKTNVADGTNGVYVVGAQLEAGAFPTSYVPTTTATVTRAADVASITGSNFSSWYNQTEGTVFSDCSINYTVPGTSFPIAASLSDGTTNNSIENGFLTSTLAGYEVATGGVAQVGMYPNAGNSLTRRLATSFKFNDFAASVNGGIINADTSGTIPTIDRLRIGGRIASSGTSSLFGTIRRLTYWPTRLANTTLQAITQ